MKLTRSLLAGLMAGLRELFDVARLVDASAAEAWDVSEDGGLVACEGRCHAVWGKDGRCRDCTSSRCVPSSIFEQKLHLFNLNSFVNMLTGTGTSTSPVERVAIPQAA